MFIENNEINNTLKAMKTTLAFCDKCGIDKVQDLKTIYNVLKNVKADRIKNILTQIRRHA